MWKMGNNAPMMLLVIIVRLFLTMTTVKTNDDDAYPSGCSDPADPETNDCKALAEWRSKY